MSSGMHIFSAALVGLLLYVVFLGPLLVVWIMYKNYRARAGFHFLCEKVGASPCGDGVSAIVATEGYELTLACLSESTREVFSEIPLAIPPRWWRLVHLYYFWPRENRSHLLAEFPYLPININHGPVLALMSRIIYPHPFIIRRRRALERRLSKEIQLDDTNFARHSRVATDDPSGMTRYLTAERRRAILNLFDLGIEQITYVKGAGILVLSTSPSFLTRHSRTNSVPLLLELTRTLLPPESSKRSSGFTALTLPSARRNLLLSRARAEAFTFCAALLALVPMLFGHSQSRQLLDKPTFSIIQISLTAAALVLFGLVAKRTALFKRKGWILPLLFCGALPMFIGGTMALINSGLDRSVPMWAEAIVGDVSSHKWIRGFRQGPLETHDEVNLTLSRCEREQCVVSVEIQPELADRLRRAKGARAQVSIRTGALGFSYASGGITISDSSP
jgi:hypothetical protein